MKNQAEKFITNNILISLYKSNLNKEKELYIKDLYQSINNDSIDNKSKQYSLIINDNEDLFMNTAFKIAENLNVVHFTNPDFFHKNYSDILIHNVYCNNSTKIVLDKIKKLLNLHDTNTLINFKNIDKATPEVLEYLQTLSDKKLDNFLFNFNSCSTLELNPNVKSFNLTPNKKLKP